MAIVSLVLIVGCGSTEPDALPVPAPAPAAVPAPVSAPVPAPVPTLPSPERNPLALSPVVADLHVDTPTQMVRRKLLYDDEALEAGLPAVRAGGVNLAVMVLWPERRGSWAATVEAQLSAAEAEDLRLEAVRLVRTPAEVRALPPGQVGWVYALEGAHGIDHAGLDGLRALHARGLGMVGLAWSFSNRFAGSSGDGGGGLSDAGRALIAEANRLGILVDVSHASDAATLEACAVSRSPLVASHSNADAVHDHRRNLSDAAVRCIAASGGVIGLNMHGDFLGPVPSVQVVADHAEALRALGGPGVVALGSDYDGIIQPPLDLRTATDLPKLWAELEYRGWRDEDVRGVKGENFMRAWEAALAKAEPSR